MNRQIEHRGPDDAGTFVSGSVGLAMRRLSIIDLKTGHQPLSNENESVWIVYNGEIYNHQSLRQDLQGRGHQYRTHSDTETIVHLYEEYGRDCVKHMRGMFAFAIWDIRSRRLFVARDRLGIKPLYYKLNSTEFLFGSEIKTILEACSEGPRLNRATVPEYLAFGYLSGKDTLFSGIHKLMPGHWLELDELGNATIEPYWDFKIEEPQKSGRLSDHVHDYRALLEESVVSHLMADVPVGVFLSGGLDSSAVAALMAKHRSDKIKTFSVGYAERTYSELDGARAVAQHIDSEHYEVRVSRDEFLAALPRLIWHEDEPITWPSSLSLYFVARLAREHVTVVLTGEGSDETLAGYGRHAFTIWNAPFGKAYHAMLPQFARSRIRSLAQDSKLLSSALRRKLSHTFPAVENGSWTSLYFDNFYSAFSQQAQQSLLTESLLREAADPYENVMKVWESSRGDLLQRMLYTDCHTYLVELLMKQDNMSMAASIESRVPFLDHVVAEYALGIPSEFKTKGLTGKRILKLAVADLLPDSVIYQKKLGFPTPLQKWLRGPGSESVRNVMLSERSLNRGLFERSALEQLFAEHASGTDHTDRLWRLLNLEIWQRVFFDADREWDDAASRYLAASPC
jgi:asparagine synthase (glutamine-hydrolysing)